VFLDARSIGRQSFFYLKKKPGPQKSVKGEKGGKGVAVPARCHALSGHKKGIFERESSTLSKKKKRRKEIY